MKYNFSNVINRRFKHNKDSKESISYSPNYSLKWNVEQSEIPAWVADMDYKIAPEIKQGLQELVNHGIFGYSVIPNEYYTSIIHWWEVRYGFKITKEWIIFASGVIPAIASIIRANSKKGDKILIQTPVYHVFHRCIKENKREVIENKLIYDNGKYSIDFQDLESKLKKKSVKIMLLCNPHNPIGRIWERDELRKIGHLCAKYNVLVVADEIHCDITFKQKYIPFASIDSTCANNSISTFSPSKSFNIADLHTAFVVISNEDLRSKMRNIFAIEYVNNPSAFGLKASILAYSKSKDWLESLLHNLDKNREIVTNFIIKNIPKLYVVEQNATYLMWIDCSQITNNTDSLCRLLRKKAGLYVSNGSQFGENGRAFFRLNIATPQKILKDILERLKLGIEMYCDKYSRI